MKVDRHYVLVFLNLEGDIYLDLSLRNKENKLIFKRVSANKYHNSKKSTEWEMKMDIKKISLYLEKNGLEIIDEDIPMLFLQRKISKNLSYSDIYYFAKVQIISSTLHNEDIVLVSWDELKNDESFDSVDKKALESYFNGEAI